MLKQNFQFHVQFKRHQIHPNVVIFKSFNLETHNYIFTIILVIHLSLFSHLHAYVAIIATHKYIWFYIYITEYSILLFYIQVQHSIGVMCLIFDAIIYNIDRAPPIARHWTCPNRVGLKWFLCMHLQLIGVYYQLG